MTIWGSTVDFNADEQIRNRNIVIEVKSDSATLKKIHTLQNKIASGKYQTPNADKVEVAICQAIMADLGPKEFNVIIPFAENIEFNNTDPRTASMFRDIIRASAIWNYAKRSTDKHGRLEANEEDFNQALDMFDSIGGQSANKWTEAERNILQTLINNERKATYGEVSKALDISKPRIFEILNGRDKKDNQKKYGLLSKCPQLSINMDKTPYILELDKKFVLEPGKLNIVLKAD